MSFDFMYNEMTLEELADKLCNNTPNVIVFKYGDEDTIKLYKWPYDDFYVFIKELVSTFPSGIYGRKIDNYFIIRVDNETDSIDYNFAFY